MRDNPLNARGKWTSANANIKDVKMLAVLFKDLKEKQFIASCSTDLNGEPRVTKHHGNIARPKVAETYLKMAAGIDIHNHIRTGSASWEDVWKTKSYIHRQFAGITGFIFTNTFLAINYFNNFKVDITGVSGIHTSFKMKLANQLVSYKDSATRLARCAP